MTLRTIAYAADESLLLTFDGAWLFAFDAASGAPLWQLELRRKGPVAIAGVVFASPNTLGPGPAASPWRSGMSGSAAIVVDVDGGVHLVDASSGRVVNTSAPLGPPTAIASVADALAIATAETVHVWRDGAKSELPLAATALAFSSDGTLAIGSKKGTVTIEETPSRTVMPSDAPIRALAWSARTGWLAGTDQGLFAALRGTKLLDGRVRALAIDAASARVAIPRGDQSALVYDWPIGATALTRIAVKRTAITDLAFGPNGRVGVSLTRGDAAIIDVVDQTGKRVQPQPGRPPARWQLDVGIDPAKLPEQRSPSFTKLGVGGIGMIAIAGRLILAAMRTSSSPNWTPPPDFSKELRCDESCARGRLVDLRRACIDTGAVDCQTDAEDAQSSFAVGDCAGARRAVAAVETKALNGGSDGKSGVFSAVIMAKMGLTACKDAAQDGVFAFLGIDLEPRHIDVPFRDGTEPVAVYVAPSSQVYISAVNRAEHACELWRSVGLSWQRDATSDQCTSAQIFGRGNDVYVAFGHTVKHFSTAGWEDLHWQGAPALQITGPPEHDGDIFITTEDNVFARYHGGKWTTEAPPKPNLVLGAMTYGTDVLLVGATDTSGKHILLRRTDSRSWFSGSWGPGPLYVGPDGEFLAPQLEAFSLSSDGGAPWAKSEMPFRPLVLWQRTPSDIYAGGSGGLARWDGEAWHPTSFHWPIIALSGNTAELYAIVSHER